MSVFTLASFAAHAAGHLAHNLDHAKHEALERAARTVEKEAKRVIGTYDYGWAPLAQSTLDSKQGHRDTPLLETGEMRDSIEHTVDTFRLGDHVDEAFIGSNNDKAVWHELGTSTIPARPFLVSAAIHKEDAIVKAIGEHFHARLVRS